MLIPSFRGTSEDFQSIPGYLTSKANTHSIAVWIGAMQSEFHAQENLFINGSWWELNQQPSNYQSNGLATEPPRLHKSFSKVTKSEQVVKENKRLL